MIFISYMFPSILCFTINIQAKLHTAECCLAAFVCTRTSQLLCVVSNVDTVMIDLSLVCGSVMSDENVLICENIIHALGWPVYSGVHLSTTLQLTCRQVTQRPPGHYNRAF